MLSEERRSYVRGDFPFKVKFRLVTPEEYEKTERSRDRIVSSGVKTSIDGSDTNKTDTESTPNAFMIDFLLQMDEKLDRILAMLSEDQADEGFLYHGIGSNISGSGMNVTADRSVEPGQIIYANLVLSKSPLVLIDLLGEVVRVTPVEEDSKRTYQLGIEFLDLDPNDRERIIGCIFQRQRAVIRRSKAERQ